MNSIRKTVYTLNLNKYAPDITAITYPLIGAWAEKIDAEFIVIDKERFPGWPVTYQKLAVREIAESRCDDWSIFIDSDALVHPDFFDPTAHVSKDTVIHNGKDPAMLRWRYDEYFLRDGRHISSCNWFACASDWCRDLWTPLDIPLQNALENIRPLAGELNSGLVEPEHLIDDYTLSRNIARYGLKFVTMAEICGRFGFANGYLWHLYQISNEEKVKRMKVCLDNLQKYGLFINPTPPPEPTGRLDQILQTLKEWPK